MLRRKIKKNNTSENYDNNFGSATFYRFQFNIKYRFLLRIKSSKWQHTTVATSSLMRFGTHCTEISTKSAEYTQKQGNSRWIDTTIHGTTEAFNIAPLAKSRGSLIIKILCGNYIVSKAERRIHSS